MLGSLILYLKSMRMMMFQLFGFYYSIFRLSLWCFGVSGSQRVLAADFNPGLSNLRNPLI